MVYGIQLPVYILEISACSFEAYVDIITNDHTKYALSNIQINLSNLTNMIHPKTGKFK